MEEPFRITTFDLHTAAANWINWRQDYEWGGNDLPILNCEGRFSRFCAEYRVPSRGTKGRAKLQKLLFQSLEGKLCQKNCPDALADLWSKTIFPKRELSLATKLLAFRNPKSFVAMDTYSKRGLRRLLKGPKIESYQEYFLDFCELENSYRDQINSFVHDANDISDKAGLSKRVVDVALMRAGNRWRNLSRPT